ncbi:glycosyltransferase family 4 protein [Motiliproteus sp. MSK22-1]|uniref:glycosyltransferase family 4 protein n=1 Tax=Motiliproteus sp. MSK22-1 TaxID=1897630 RepID=UPI000976E4B4|nr:glycosyltransferase family 4 protein [Motiliproteus sp. MSK22-1]OMH25667.1 hypothetical protein BGP75_24295 [Motiliproteus sp. MSK22-1]
MRKPTSVAHVVASLKVGGAERFVIDLCRSQAKKGLQPIIVSLGAADDLLVAEAATQNIPVTIITGSRSTKQLRMFLTLKKCQILHVHSPHSLKFMSFVLPLLRKKKIVYTRHGAAPLKANHWVRLHKHAARFINAIAFVSKEGADAFHSTHDWRNVPSLVIDNGVSIDQMRPEPLNSEMGVLRLGSVGRMVPLKNQIGLLHAIALLDKQTRSGIEVHFFGDGDCLSDLKEYHSSNLNDINVVFHGMIKDRDKIYNSFDALVVTSETEGLSLAIIEAMVYQRAIIATDVGGNPRLVENDVTGWLIPYNDPNVLSGCIRRLMESPQLLAKLAQASRTKVLAEFSIDAAAMKYEELYKL